MNRTICGLLFSILFLALSGRTQAQTINAASCNESDVQKAISSVTTDGATVLIPTGNCNWTTSLNLTLTHSMTLQGAGAVSYSPTNIAGTGTDKTILTDSINRSTGDSPLLGFITITGKSLRITGIAFYWNQANATATYNGSVRVLGASTSVRIDHCHFNQIWNVDMQMYDVQGVIDHNQFDAGHGSENQMRFNNGGTSGYGNESWTVPANFGSSQFMFVENNNYQFVQSQGAGQNGGFVFDCTAGGRGVFRYNNMGFHEALQTHLTGPGLYGAYGQNARGCRALEIYGNVMTYSSSPITDNYYASLELEGGTALIWGNTYTGYLKLVQAYYPRVNTTTYQQVAPPNGWGYCGSIQTGSTSAWDQNTNSTGAACIDQIGRGAGDLVTGVFPNTKNSATGTITWPHQASEPVYAWNNIYNPPPQESGDHYWGSADGLTTENRDYYLQLPNYDESATFNGTAGVGQGLLSNRAATCTKGVGYWATDTNTLYTCTAVNTWALYYTGYTYPHPLVQGSQTGNNATPSNLTTIVH